MTNADSATRRPVLNLEPRRAAKRCRSHRFSISAACLAIAASAFLAACAIRSEQQELDARVAGLRALVPAARKQFHEGEWNRVAVGPDAHGTLARVDGPVVAIRLDAHSPRIPLDWTRPLLMAIHDGRDYKGEVWVMDLWRDFVLGVVVLETRKPLLPGDPACVYTFRQAALAMQPDRRVVISLPLPELWRPSGPIDARRGRGVGREEIQGMLRAGPVQFVVAEPGQPLRWVPRPETSEFWKSEVVPRLVPAAADSFRPEDYLGERCYLASEWLGAPGPRIVLLEVHH